MRKSTLADPKSARTIHFLLTSARKSLQAARDDCFWAKEECERAITTENGGRDYDAAYYYDFICSGRLDAMWDAIEALSSGIGRLNREMKHHAEYLQAQQTKRAREEEGQS